MTDHRVIWEIDIEADSPEEAAKEALLIQRDTHSIASVFTVINQESCEEFEVDIGD